MDRATKIEIDKMNAFFERMNGHYTQLEAEAINESIEELDARGREDISTAYFPLEIQKIKGGTWCTIGYVSAADLDYPMEKRLNPETKRMKSYPDFATFGKNLGVQDEISGVIKFTRYTIRWRNSRAMSRYYLSKYVEPVNAIRSKYGLADIERRDFSQQQNTVTQLPSYTNQDTGGDGKCHTQYFLIGKNGSIIREVSANELVPYFKKHSISGIADLRKLNKSDEEIKAYANEIAKLNFRYTRFNYASIVYVITTINGKPKRFFNTELTDDIKGTGVNPSEFIEMAKKMYKIDLENVAAGLVNTGEFDDN